MNLFDDIHSLLRKGQSSMYEDLLTEIFADLLKDNEYLDSFCNTFISDGKIRKPENIVVSTQRTFLRSDCHESDSRPDLVVQFRTENRKYFLLFENKVEAAEGKNQLTRYADHLVQYEKSGYQTFLFYITKYDDPKKEEDIFKEKIATKFVQLRWYMIYYWLKEKDNIYVRKVLRFMEAIGLNETRRFLPQDIYAIQHMSRLQRMMDECLDGIVDDEMDRLFGKASQWSNRNTQLRDCGRYFKVSWQNELWVGCGFYLTEDEYPLVSVICEVSPKNEKRTDVIKSYRDFLIEKTGWEGYDLDDEMAWPGICYEKPLLDFLHEEDHINAIQKFFLEKLNELYSLKQNNIELGWK